MKMHKKLLALFTSVCMMFYMFSGVPVVVNAAPGDPPVVLGAETSADGTKVLITFDKAMNDPTGMEADFAVTLDGVPDNVTAAGLNTNTAIIELTLLSAVQNGDVVLVSYNPGTLTAVDTGALATITDQAVTNNVPPPPQFQSAQTSVDGSKVLITFDKNMSDPTGNEPNFTVNIDATPVTVDSVALNSSDHSIIELTLQTAAENGKTVTVAYSAGTVSAEDSSVLESFGDQAVTNSVPVPPTFVSADTNANGSKVLVTFSKNMGSPVGKHAQFTVEVGGAPDAVTAAALNGSDAKIIELTVTDRLHDTDSITVGYTPGSVNAADGGILASFATEPVTNSVSAAPTFVSATTNASGSKVLVTFSKNMSSPVGMHGQFTVEVGGVANPATAAALDGGDNKIVVLTLTTPVLNGESVTVAYAEGVLDAADGGVLEAFAAQPVTNGVTIASPIVSSAATSADGTKVLVTFDKDMNDPIGMHGQFTVKLDGVSDAVTAAALNGSDSSIVELTLTTAVENGQTVTVSYAEGVLEAADGGVLATFSNRAVTNSVIAPPTFVSAETSADGTKVLVTFSKDMASPVGKHGEFTVQVGGSGNAVTAAALNGSDPSIVELTLTTAAANGQSVTVGYTKGTLNAADGGILESFAGETVTNSVVAPPTFVSAETSADGTKVLVTFSKDMASPVGKHGQFTVQAGGSGNAVTAAVLNGSDPSIVELTLTTAVANGQSVTVGYTKGTLNAADGGILATFAGETVTNSVPAPPTFVSAETSADGAKVIVTFSKDMASPVGKHAQFTVQVGGSGNAVTAAALNGSDPSIVELTLTTAVANGQSVTVGYTKGTLNAADGGILATFAGETVTNSVPAPPTFSSAATSADGTKVLVTFSKDMASPVGKHAQFTVQTGGSGNAVTAAALNGSDSSIVELTLTTAVANGQSVTVAYTKGTLNAADGGVLATFTAQTVTNIVAAPPTFESAATNTDGTKVLVTFSKNMASPAGKHAQFTVRVNGTPDAATAAALNGSDGSIVELTLTTPVTVGQTVTVAYTRGDLNAADGGMLATFAAQTVTNEALPAAPTFASAVTNSDGTKVLVTFNKNMASPVGKHAQFTVRADGTPDAATAAALNGSDAKIIELTLTTAIENGQTVTVAYTEGTVAAADTGVLATFAAQPVTNSVAVPAPTVLSAETSEDGTKVLVTFSKDMEDPSGSPTAFSVRIGSTPNVVTAAALNGSDSSIIELTVTTPIQNGQVVTVGYTAGSLTAADGGILATFTGHAVTNNVPLTPAFVSAAVSADGLKILVTFNKEMADPSAHPEEFTVNAGGAGNVVTAAALNGSNAAIIELTLTNKIYSDTQNVKVSYTAGTLTSEDLMTVATFTNRDVTNSSTEHRFTVSTAFKVGSTSSATALTANQILDANASITNNQEVEQSVILVVALYNQNHNMVNVSYLAKTVGAGDTEEFHAGFKLPSAVTGYYAKAFVWDGTDIATSPMTPVSNAVQIPE